jgi:hypothetical protein
VDRTTHWRSVNQETVRDFTDLGVRLHYTVGNPSDGCTPEPGMVVLCEKSINPDHAANASVGIPRGGALVAYNTLYPNPHENIACHEFMHVLAAVGDAYDTDQQSCVWGSHLLDPGPTDVELLRRADRIP